VSAMAKVVVLDTCVFVAGLLSPRKSAGALVSAFFSDRLRLAYTEPILAEYAEVLERPDFVGIITPADRIGLILKVRSSGVRIEPAAVPSVRWPDPDDLPFVAAALGAEDKLLVTLNPRDFEPAAAFGLQIMSPALAKLKLL
jgi:putative PIN family toxin of toxin-antitoxin system